MNILINFSTLKAGGGQNVAMNFLYSDLSWLNKHRLLFFVAKNSEPHKYLMKNKQFTYYVLPRNPIVRILYEVLIVRFILKKEDIDIIYSYFGFGFYFSSTPQVTGSADSNLYFPEIDFWADYKGFQRLKKKLVDTYRLTCLKQATGIVYENEAMLKRAKNLFNFENTAYIKPSISAVDSDAELLLPKFQKNSIKCLFFCGWQLNKNIMLIPHLINYFEKHGKQIEVVLTVSLDESSICQDFVQLMNESNTESSIHLVGSISKKYMRSLYEQIDFVFLLSKLESFSNNIIEAWYYKKPLIISDEEWSRAICSDAVIYVKRDSVVDIFAQMTAYLQNVDDQNKLLNNSQAILSTYPNIENRVKQEMEYLEYVHKNS